MDQVRVSEADFDMAAEYEVLRQNGAGTGAIATFTGLVRDNGDLNGVTGLYLEHYPGMTEQVIEDLIRQARERWDIRQARVVHRVGHLALEEQIVFVGVCSAHRGDAFAACQFLMDALKTSAPFWKKEVAGQAEHWVEQKETDHDQAGRWHR